MKVYFVRHGSSTLTEARHQRPETRLSELGFKQALAVSRRLTNIPVDIILTSTYSRALQTARVIENHKHAPLIQTDLLTERKMPSEFLGKEVDDPRVVPVHQAIREHFHDPRWHHTDEENAAELLSRAGKALDFIVSQKGESVVVVTHGYFLIVLVFSILFDRSTDSRLLQQFRGHMSASNAGLTLCEYVGGKWSLVTWNDFSHLQE